MTSKADALWLVLCAKYNNSRDVPFMMREDDDRFDNGNYKPIEPGEYDEQAQTLTVGDQVYTVFEDWSVRLRTD